MCAESILVTPAMLEAGLDVITEHWPEWPYGEYLVSLMLKEVFGAMKACELREKTLSDFVADRKNVGDFSF
jgi:hypothetical protein